jgi:hypothetical protein
MVWAVYRFIVYNDNIFQAASKGDLKRQPEILIGNKRRNNHEFFKINRPKC